MEVTMARKVALSLLLAAAACAGGGADAPPPPPGGGGGPATGPATVTAYCDQYWTTLATRWAACAHGSAAYFAGIYDPALRCTDMVNAVAGGRATYQPARAGACLDHVDTASCADLAALLADESPQADCLAAVAGHLAQFEACYSNESCASDLCFPGVCPGGCVTPSTQGGACPFCARGLICDTSNYTCELPKAQGSLCMNHSECQPGLYCDPGIDPKTCQPQKTEGACTSDAASALGYQCAGTCVLLRASGETCTKGQNQCGPGLWCATSTCVDGPVPTQSCATQAGEHPPCIGGWCNGGTSCAAWLAVGAQCTGLDQCGPTAWCDTTPSPYVCTACTEP
jgi:hypothetical protein